jgi:hypothetical protein
MNRVQTRPARSAMALEPAPANPTSLKILVAASTRIRFYPDPA